MRVTLLNQYYAPDEAATAQVLSDLGKGLVAAGHDVTAICGDRSYADPSRRYPRRETLRGVHILRAGTTAFGRGSKLGRILDYVSFYLGAGARLVFGPRADVVVALTTPPFIALAAVLAGRIRRFPVVFWSMDVYPDLAFELGAVSPRSPLGWALRKTARLLHRSADLVIALGETMAARLRDAGATRVEVVHNWSPDLGIADCGLRIADLGKGTSRGDRGELGEGTENQAEVPIGARSTNQQSEIANPKCFTVMYSGNLGMAHEFETILAAAQRLADPRSSSCEMTSEEPSSNDGARLDALRTEASRRIGGSAPHGAGVSIQFIFAGGGPRMPEVRKRVEEMGLANVEIRGYVAREELGASLRSADLHLVTLRERIPGLLVPSKIYGILSAGRPALYVGPAVGEVHDILAVGRCGTRVANGDVDGTVSAILEYAGSPERCAEEGRNARALFEARFTREKSVARFVELIEGVGRMSAPARVVGAEDLP